MKRGVMNMKLIDLEKLRIGLKNIEVFEDKSYAKGWNDAIRCIMMEPVVDAVEVVRCKDCISYGITTNNGNPLSYMCGACGKNDFCSNGVRKDDSSKN